MLGQTYIFRCQNILDQLPPRKFLFRVTQIIKGLKITLWRVCKKQINDRPVLSPLSTLINNAKTLGVCPYVSYIGLCICILSLNDLVFNVQTYVRKDQLNDA